MVTLCENRVISIKLIKKLESPTYMFHPQNSLLEVTYQYEL
jgi:hypothetical protein